jgi:hypothetical protein
MPSDSRRLTAAELGERIIDALVPALPPPPGPLPPDWHVPPTWSQVWSEVRTVCGPLRGVFFIAWVVVSFPVLFIVTKLVTHPGVTALLLTAVLGTGALWIWGWPGLLVVCLLLWLFTIFLKLFRQVKKRTGPHE